MPERIQLRRVKGWRLPPGAASVARPTKWGNPFAYRTTSGLARVPAALGDGPWEYEGRISADGMQHDYHHADGHVTVCHVRYMTMGEIVETYRRVLTGDITPAMRSSLPSGRFLKVTVADVRRELAGKSLACWCPPGEPCHADVLLAVASPETAACRHCGALIERCYVITGAPTHDYPMCRGWRHVGYDSQPVIGHCCEGRMINPAAEPGGEP
jgi:hypothetical protein